MYENNAETMTTGNVNHRIPKVVLYALLAGTFMAIAGFFGFAHMRTIMTLTPDDTGYYCEIAENVVGGHGFTGDQINKTNGFQPLWQGMLIPLFFFTKAISVDAKARLVLFFGLALLVPATILVVRLSFRAFQNRTTLIVGALFAYLVLLLAANGMESGVLILTLSMLAWYAFSRRETLNRNWRQQLILGLILGLVMLSRLDMVFLGAIVCAAFIWPSVFGKQAFKKGVLACIVIICGASVLVLPYLVFNVTQFGHLTPISGTIKSTFPAIAPISRLMLRFDKRTLLFAAMAVVFFLHGVIAEFRPARDATEKRVFVRRMTTVMAGYVVLHFLYTLLFTHWLFCYWQFMAYPFFACFAVGEVVDYLLYRADGRAVRIMYGLVAAALVLFIVGKEIERFSHTYKNPLQASWHSEVYAAAKWVNENLDESAILAMEHSGIFGYFTERRVVNLDGMVNHYSFQDVLKEKRLNQYFVDNGIEYFGLFGFGDRRLDVVHERYETYSKPFRSHRAGVDSDELTFRPSDEVFRSAPYDDDGEDTVMLIWRYPHAVVK